MFQREDLPSNSKLRKLLLEELKTYMTMQRDLRMDEVLLNRTQFITVVTEDLYQVHNVSALIRTCDCFGIQDIHAIQNINEFNHTEKISRGAEKWVDVYEHYSDEGSSNHCIRALREKGYQIVATTPHNDGIDLNEFKVDRPIALFFGQEKPGLSEDILEEADVKLSIPMFGFTESFNISVAAALILNRLSSEMRKLPPEIWRIEEEEREVIKLLWILRTIQSPNFVLKHHLELIQKNM